MLDSIQPANLGIAETTEDVGLDIPKVCASKWREFCKLRPFDEPDPKPDRKLFWRQTPSFFLSLLVFLDRGLLQVIREWKKLLANQILVVACTCLLCVVLTSEELGEYQLQTGFVSLFLMLIQGVAAQRVFGSELLTIKREAGVGMRVLAFFTAKDLTTFLEISLSSAVFATTFSTFSHTQIPIKVLFPATWAFVYSVYGLNYIFSVLLSQSAAQMS